MFGCRCHHVSPIELFCPNPPVLDRIFADGLQIGQEFRDRPSARGWINEDVQELDASILNMGDVSTCDGCRAMRSPGPPEKSSDSVVAHSMPDRAKDEVGWKTVEQVVDGLRDRLRSGRNGLGVVEGCILCVELADCGEADGRVS